MIIDAPPLSTRPHGRVWVHSDLQLADPAVARQVLSAAVDDLLELDLGLDAAWCLGDAICGKHEASLQEVVDATVEQLARLAVPVCYVMGNHEMDLKRHGIDRYPLYDRACQENNWHTMASLEDFFFARTFCGALVIFMGDHAAKDKSWWSSHGKIKEAHEKYPHTPAQDAALRDAMASHPGPVVIASHYAFPGGQRPSELMGLLQPLPGNVRLHMYGHAHIGDLVHNKDFPWRRDNPTEGQSLRQFNISALETRRSPGSHSAILDFDETGPTTLRIRCHLERKWVESFEIAAASEVAT